MHKVFGERENALYVDKKGACLIVINDSKAAGEDAFPKREL